MIPASSNIHGGPDDMVFRFIAAIGSDVVPNPPTDEKGANDFTRNDDMDGRHIARFTPNGFFALGPNFGHTFDNVAHVRPQSMFHMSSYQQDTAWMQITNQTGTGQTIADGLRIGITGTGTAHIKQQEDLPLIFYTNNLSTARIVPGQSSFITSLSMANPGMMGIGDFSTLSLPIDAKLDIDGDLRIRLVEEKNTLTRVLVVDENDQNRVFYRSVDDLGNGINCWDTNGDGIDDPSEDTNGDLAWDALDCQGAIGPQGPVGATGPQGPAGTGGGTVTADNGLHIFGSNNVRLGGTLVENTNVILSNFSLNFSGSGRIGIGNVASSMLNIQNSGNWLNVLRISNSLNTEMLTFTDDRKLTIKAQRTSGEQAVYMENTIINSPGSVAALYGLDVYTTSTDVSNPYTGARIRMEAISNQTITGLFVAARSKPENQGTSNYIGIHATADRGTDVLHQNVGVLGQAANCSLNIGVRGTATGPAGAINWAGFFDGNVNVTGTLFANNGTFSTSDQQFKQNIQPLTNATILLSQLAPKTFDYDSINFTRFNFDTDNHMGLIAQEVSYVLPNLVKESVLPAEFDSLGNQTSAAINYKSLNYQELIPLMIAGMKEQQQTISNLQSTVEDLKNCLNNANICTEGHRTMNTEPSSNNSNYKSIELTNVNSIILDQSQPNPFSENTVINYNIPTEVAEAKLLFYDLNGRIIKELIIEERGESKLTVYGTNLKTGVYTYSLIADGELIATKKMVKK